MKPVLNIDLSGPQGNIFCVVGLARTILEAEVGKEEAKKLDLEMWAKVQQCESYEKALDVVNEYVEIDDESGVYHG